MNKTPIILYNILKKCIKYNNNDPFQERDNDTQRSSGKTYEDNKAAGLRFPILETAREFKNNPVARPQESYH